MLNIICFSGGKDSTALILWAKENLDNFTAVFCDTGWEHPETYKYIDYINGTLLDGELIVLESEGMKRLVERKQRIPSAKARFCTEDLKVRPMIKWIDSIDDERIIYQGIRAEESQKRAEMAEKEWSDVYDGWVVRPLIKWTSKEVFELLDKHGVKPNPLYLNGASRVGCFPCVMINHGDIRRMQKFYPEIWDRIGELEDIVGRSFFSPNYIPVRYQSGFCDKSNKSFPWVEDVKEYLADNEGYLFEPSACMSIYNLCE